MALPVRQEDGLVDGVQVRPPSCVTVSALGAAADNGANGEVFVQLAQHVIDEGRFIEISPAGYE